jgi:hypothetical protein
MGGVSGAQRGPMENVIGSFLKTIHRPFFKFAQTGPSLHPSLLGLLDHNSYIRKHPRTKVSSIRKEAPVGTPQTIATLPHVCTVQRPSGWTNTILSCCLQWNPNSEQSEHTINQEYCISFVLVHTQHQSNSREERERESTTGTSFSITAKTFTVPLLFHRFEFNSRYPTTWSPAITRFGAEELYRVFHNSLLPLPKLDFSVNV